MQTSCFCESIFQLIGNVKKQFIPVLGLYSNCTNEIIFKLEDGREKVVKISTDPAPESIHIPEYVHTTKEYFGEKVMFVTPSSFSKMVAFDYAGDLRWYTTIDIVFDIKRVKNGHIWIATERLIELPYNVTGIYEMSMLGKIYKEYRLPAGTHHDYVEDKDGNIVILTADPNRDTVEDVCLVLNRETGKVIKTFDLKQYFSTEAVSGNRASTNDWLHCNAVWYDEKTNSLSFSGRNLDAIMNIDYETQKINWILGDPEKWPQEYVDKYFFTPDPAQETFEWFYAQHACMILPDGDVLLFDNGAWRSKYAEKDIPAEEKFSRGVRYHLDLEKRIVTQVWQFGKEEKSDFFSPHISNIDYYGKSNYMVHSGDIGQINGVPCVKPPLFYLDKPEAKDLVYYARTVELKGNNIVYEMKIPSNAYYRAKKLSLYDEKDVLQFGEGQLLGTLGMSHTVRLKVPTTSEPLPAFYNAKIFDEIDRLKFSIMLETGTYACLVFKNDKRETLAYSIPTAEKDELAMCVGTFQLENANEAFVTVSKEGLKDHYDLYVYIEGKLYDLKTRLSLKGREGQL